MGTPPSWRLLNFNDDTCSRQRDAGTAQTSISVPRNHLATKLRLVMQFLAIKRENRANGVRDPPPLNSRVPDAMLILHSGGLMATSAD